ncbi:MAG: 7-carboxy-7-deazaguanine synthase QueE [Gammaproteobacteria bacterium]|nr:7-carboxy-7-deazaguanine synthase QueE [Gammaproteobacteria bacterium]
MTSSSLRITEIFHSLQGEARTVGLPTVFVRLTGCPLRCQYCDTEYAFNGGISMSLESIVKQVATYSCRYVTVTGGEPLAQSECLSLLRLLCDRGFEVSLETSGALGIGEVDERVSVVMDLKTPNSMEQDKNRYENIELLRKKDQVKFVICDRGDYDWARARLEEFELPKKAGEILFSPSYEQLEAAQLADWILRDRLPVRMQVQLHKLLWGDQPGR